MLITRPVLTPPPRAFFPAARLLLHVRTRSHPPTAEHGWNVDKRPRESFCVCARRDCAERRYALAPRARHNAAGGKKRRAASRSIMRCCCRCCCSCLSVLRELLPPFFPADRHSRFHRCKREKERA